MPEILSGLLVLFVVLWEACFEGVANSPAYREAFVDGTYLLLCGLVWFNTLVVILHLVSEWVRYGVPGRFLWVQLLVGIVASVAGVIFWVLGIVNAINGRAKTLPLIGKITLLK